MSLIGEPDHEATETKHDSHAHSPIIRHAQRLSIPPPLARTCGLANQRGRFAETLIESSKFVATEPLYARCQQWPSLGKGIAALQLVLVLVSRPGVSVPDLADKFSPLIEEGVQGSSTYTSRSRIDGLMILRLQVLGHLLSVP